MTPCELWVAAEHASMPGVLAWLDALCAALGVPADDGKRLAIIIEELFLNTVDHGYGESGTPGAHAPGRAAPIRYRLARLDAVTVELTQEDAGPPFDITDATPQTATLERVGGLGIAMVQGMSKTLSYRREGGRNITAVTL